MAKTRTYHQEYLDRTRRAIERGFTSYNEERNYRAAHRDVLTSGIVKTTLREMFPNIDLGPQELVDLWETLDDYLMGGEEEITGQMRHELVSFFVEQGMTEDTAVRTMKEVLGTS